MEVKLISLTQDVLAQAPGTERGGNMTPEELIVYIARVSNPSNQMNLKTADKLLTYLIKNKHWSPFEMVDMTVSITTSRAIAQQILRHRSFSFQEFSQRYATVTEMEPVVLRKQADKNRQSSTEEFNPIVHVSQSSYSGRAGDAIAAHLKISEALYKELLVQGVAKECARFVLPLTTQTKIYMKGSVRSWIHYLLIRTDGHTQKEHHDIALSILEIFKASFPNISKALF